MLRRVEGDRVLALDDVRGQPNSAGQPSNAPAAPRLPPAWVVRGEGPPGQSMQALDYRGVPVLAVVQPVRGSGWWLVAKQAVAEFEQLVVHRTRALQAAHDLLARADRFNRTITDNLPSRVACWDVGQRCRYANRGFYDGYGETPSILVTAHDDPTLAQQARSVGCEAVLVKPITASALHDTLVAVLRAPRRGVLAARSQAGASEAALRRQWAGRRVLVVEDNPVNQEVAAQLLRLAGLPVETASHGAEAVDQVLAQRYDLVLMDRQLPVMDGLTATRLIRARLGDALPIIAMTANAFSEDRLACLATGMNDHVAKPVDPEVLYATLLQWLPASGEPTDTLGACGRAARPPLPERLAAIEGFDLADALLHVGHQLPLLPGLQPALQQVQDELLALAQALSAALQA